MSHSKFKLGLGVLICIFLLTPKSILKAYVSIKKIEDKKKKTEWKKRKNLTRWRRERLQPKFSEYNEASEKEVESRIVRGADIKEPDITYTIEGLYPYELPVIGVYIDPKIYPGFHYRVRAADMPMFYFKGKALRLEAIGRGYGKRLEFEATEENNKNCFWSDSNPEGFAFSIQVLFPEMSFKILGSEKVNSSNSNGDLELCQGYPVLGTLTMISVENVQEELSSVTNFKRDVTKTVSCKGKCRINTKSGHVWDDINMAGLVTVVREKRRLPGKVIETSVRLIDITKIKLGQVQVRSCSVRLIPV